MSCRPICLRACRWHRRHRLCGKRTPSPTSLSQQTFEILSRSRHQSFTIDAPEPPQAKTSHPMPFFGLGEERFDPHFAFVHGLLIGESLVIALHTVQVIGVKRTMQLPTVVTLRTLRFDWTGIAGGWVGTILHFFRFELSPKRTQWLPLRAMIEIMSGIIPKVSGSIIGRHMLPIWQGNVSPNVCLFEGFDNLDGSILGIACDLLRPYSPAKVHMPE